MPHEELKCSRCDRNSYIVPIGLVILAHPNGATIRVNVCTPHIKEIEKWLNLSTNAFMKRPHHRLPKSIDTNLQLNLKVFPNEAEEKVKGIPIPKIQ